MLAAEDGVSLAAALPFADTEELGDAWHAVGGYDRVWTSNEMDALLISNPLFSDAQRSISGGALLWAHQGATTHEGADPPRSEKLETLSLHRVGHCKVSHLGTLRTLITEVLTKVHYCKVSIILGH